MLIAGAQALIVGGLLAVIYFTLLKPDDDGSLFGVEAPQDRPQVVQQPARDGEREGADRRSERGRAAGAGPAPTATELVAVGPGAAPSSAAPHGADEGAPDDDQYQDTLARLRDMLNQAP